ncbi:MAG: AAA family ATPase [Pseudomonadales bacterium]
MYLSHFGLQELPFTITPDTEFFMSRAGYQDALNVLTIALRSGEGFIKITGEVGVGKTLMCRKLIKTLPDNFDTAYIYNPYLKADSLLFSVASELGIKYKANIDQNELLRRITTKLEENHSNDKKTILCLDEVQAMPISTLEVLRLLTNLETEKDKLLQVVLFGQPELDSVLDHPSIRQLKQRITFSYELLPLNRAALSRYVQHRLLVAGYKGNNLFSKQALNLVYQASNGIPRLINIICHKAMIAAYGEGETSIKPAHVRAATSDTLNAQRTRKRGFRIWFPAISRWVAERAL